MPFTVFRKHQRKLLAVLAILAMIAFVLPTSLDALFGGRNPQARGGPNDPVVATLKWKTLRASDLEPMRVQRQRANFFLAQITGVPQYGSIFGGTNTRDLVDAVILEHEAERLGMPASAELANNWLRQITGQALNARYFEDVFRRSSLSEQVTDEQLLLEIANQVRILTVQMLPMTADATPLDVFENFKEQEERVSAYAVGVKVEDYLGKVGEPSQSEIVALYEAARDRLPDPNGPEPGFKVPHKVRFEMVTADVDTLAATLRGKLTNEELRNVYKDRKAEFPAPLGELPKSIFAGAPDLTPHDDFPDVREDVARVVAGERAREQVDVQFDDFKNNVMRPFEDKYYDTESSADAKAEEARKALRPGDLVKNAAIKAGLTYEATPLVPSTHPEGLGALGKAHLGSEVSFNAPAFETQAFLPRWRLYDPLELSDAKFRDEGGHRFLAWKIQDDEARMPSLDEVRAEVVRTWKLQKARPLAEAEAKRIASAAEKAGGGAKVREVAGKLPVVTTEPRPKMAPAALMGMNALGGYRLSEIFEIPHAGDSLRDALYKLSPQTAAVAPDATKTTYYVLTLRSRDEAEFDRLYAAGMADSFYSQAMQATRSRLIEEWRQSLREKAGLPADWAPPAGERRGADDVAGDL